MSENGLKHIISRTEEPTSESVWAEREQGEGLVNDKGDGVRKCCEIGVGSHRMSRNS